MTQTYFSDKVSDIMPYAFYSPAVDVDSVFKFLYSDPIADSVDSTQVAEWIYNYSKFPYEFDDETGTYLLYITGR